jgi:hypothetical protein
MKIVIKISELPPAGFFEYLRSFAFVKKIDIRTDDLKKIKKIEDKELKNILYNTSSSALSDFLVQEPDNIF